MVPLEDPIITETTSTLQEWGVLWKQLYVVSRTVVQRLYGIRYRTKTKQNSGAWSRVWIKTDLFLCLLQWWDKGGSGLYGNSWFFFTLCLLHLAALPAKVMKVLKKKTERTCSDSSSRDLPSHVVLTATLPFIFFSPPPSTYAGVEVAVARTPLMARGPVACYFTLRRFSGRSMPVSVGPLAISASSPDLPLFASLRSVRLHLPGQK